MSNVKPAPVENYEERPLKKALAPEGYHEEVEARQPDQIEDYHKKNPTLKPDDGHDPEVIVKVLAKVHRDAEKGSKAD